MRRAAAVTLIATGAVLAATLTAGNDPGPKPPPTEKQVVGFINHQRSLYGQRRLQSSSRLAKASKGWSVVLSSRGSLFHATGLLGGLSWVAETLYRGPGGPVKPWLLSPPHRAILLNPKARLVGIGHSGNVYVGRFGAR